MASFDVVDLDKVLDDFEEDLDGEEDATNGGGGMKCWPGDAQGEDEGVVMEKYMRNG